MAHQFRRWSMAAGVIVLSVMVMPLFGQRAGSEDTLKAALVELRGIRLAMERMTSAGARVQLALGRLQLQEQRVNTMVRRLDMVRQEKASGEREATDTRDQLARLEEATDNMQDADERKALSGQSRSLAATLEQQTSDVQRLASEEAQLRSAIEIEQARWNEINRQLEELERALVR